MTEPASHLDAGSAGVWVIDANNKLYNRQGTYQDSESISESVTQSATQPWPVSGTSWILVHKPPGNVTIRTVSSGRNVVVVVDDSGRVWIRLGVGPDTPGGVSWVQILGVMWQVEVYETDDVIVLWGLDRNVPTHGIYYNVIYK